MKCTLKNLETVCALINQNHAGAQTGADFGIWDDESDLVTAVEQAVEMLEEERRCPK